MKPLADVSSNAVARSRWRGSEIVFWVLALSCAFVFPSRYLFMTDVLRLALFALSLDLILGYAGIVSLGHAAFFGVGAYSAGLLALHGIINEPGIALLMEALGERFSNITGGTDGLQGIEMQPILGRFAFDMFGKTGFYYCLI